MTTEKTIYITSRISLLLQCIPAAILLIITNLDIMSLGFQVIILSIAAIIIYFSWKNSLTGAIISALLFVRLLPGFIMNTDHTQTIRFFIFVVMPFLTAGFMTWHWILKRKIQKSEPTTIFN